MEVHTERKYGIPTANTGVKFIGVIIDTEGAPVADWDARHRILRLMKLKPPLLEHLITDFDTGLWNAVIESMTIYSKEHIVFKFKVRTEIKWYIV